MAAISDKEGRHAVFVFAEAHGHVLPTVPLMAAMAAQGVRVTYLNPNLKEPSLEQAVVSAGATHQHLDRDTAVCSNPYAANCLGHLASLLETVRGLEPPADVLVFDPFDPCPQIVGRILSIPAVALVLNTGPGCTAPFETEDFMEMFQEARKVVQEMHGIDFFEFGIPLVSWYSRTLNIVLTCEEFFEGPCNEGQREKFGQLPFECVGSLVDPADNRRAPVKDFPLDALRAARDAGKKVVLLSLGTAVTGLVSQRPLPGNGAGNDDGTKVDGKCLAEMTGEELARFVYKAAFEALGGEEDLLVVMNAGGNEGFLAGLEPELPANFRAFTSIPQLEVLQLASAFVTHGGMGSMMESIVCRVPVVAIPAFGDQMATADNAAKANFGFSFRYPLKTLTSTALGEAVRAVADASAENPYRAAIAAASAKMAANGGSTKVIDRIFSVAKST
mmetsp:Transcript_16405/g.51535  ORF Transcript_16405/g.51535 Transcript_16405/m.51535 type:complete len:446 (-) Transcript_16405:99-1436(-)